MRRPARTSTIGVAVALLVAACGGPSGSGGAEELAGQALDATIEVTSPAFADGGAVPRQFTCDGSDTSPPLAWSGVPAGAAELALVVDDPDAPRGTYVHWVLFGLDPSLGGIGEGEVPADARQSKNSAGDAGYKGPCPPPGDGAHHYRFAVYALRERIDAADGASASDALSAIRDAATAKGAMTGTFDR